MTADAAKVFETFAELNLAFDPARYKPAGGFKLDWEKVERHPSVRQRGPRKRLLGLALEAAGLTTSNASDHLRALARDAVREPAPIWTSLTLARVVLEGLVLSCYLLDPAISTELRMARAAALHITEAQNQIKAAKSFPAHVPPVDKHVGKALQLCTKAGAQVHQGHKGKFVGVSVDGHRAPMDINLTEATERYLPAGLPSTYRLTSGAAHSRPWMIASSATDGRKTDEGWAAEAATMMTAVMTVSFAMDAYVRHWSAYFGLNPDGDLAAIRRRQLWFLNRAVRHHERSSTRGEAPGSRDQMAVLVAKFLSD
jgi:hypothetical protein